MSNTNVAGNDGDGHVRRKPSYSEVLKSPPTRPAPINTEIARSNNTGAKATAGTVSTAFSSAGNTSVGTSLTTATSLFSPSIWSAIPNVTQSATIPGKDSWDRAMQKTYAQAAKSPPQQSKKLPVPASTTPETPLSPVGLGLNFGNVTVDQQNVQKGITTIPSNATTYHYQQDALTEAQLLHDGGVSISNTYPLTQQAFSASRDATYQHRLFPQQAAEFAFTHQTCQTPHNPYANTPHRVTEDAYIDGRDDGAETSTSNPFSSPETPTITVTMPSEPSEGHEIDIPDLEDPNMLGVAFATSLTGFDSSDCSDISEHCEAEERDADEKAPCVSQEAHPRSFSRVLLDNGADCAEAFPGAFKICKALNAGIFKMPYGSRAICIKTDFVENVQWSMQKGLWPTMNKVGERMNQLWDARETKDVKVFLLFSVNGQKSYCSLAEMTGRWIPGDDELVGFMKKAEDNSRHWGTLPITWLYCKNISYNWFSGILHSHNNAPIVNMWNGMHYPSAVGREVIELYVKRIHFTNILAWVKGGEYSPFKPVLKASQIDPLAEDAAPPKTEVHKNGPPQPALIENVPAPVERTKAQAIQSSNWRQPAQQHVGQASGLHPTAGPTPVAPYRRGLMPGSATATPPPNIDGHSSPTPRASRIVQCIIDDRGNFIPVTPQDGATYQPVMDARSANTPVPPSGDVHVAYSQQFGTTQASSARGGSQGSNPIICGNSGGYAGTPMPPHGTPSPMNPNYVPGQGPYRPPVSPAINRMRSQVGLEDPFGTPRGLHQARSVDSLTPQKTSMSMMQRASKATLHRAVSNADFVPQTHSPLAPTVSGFNSLMPGAPGYGSASHVTGTTGTTTPTPYGFGISGGVALHPYGPVPPVEGTPSHFPANRHALPYGPDAGLFTPSGLPTYPTPTDQAKDAIAIVDADADADSDPDKSQIEYLEALRRMQATEMTLARIKFEKANKQGTNNMGSPTTKSSRNPSGQD